MTEFMRVQLTGDELTERARRLAQRVRELALFDESAKADREDQRKERRGLVAEINRLADAVRTGAEDQRAQLGMWPDDKEA